MGQEIKGCEYLEKKFKGTDTAATSTDFYSNPGETFGINVVNYTGQAGGCYVTLSGYFVNLP